MTTSDAIFIVLILGELSHQGDCPCYVRFRITDDLHLFTMLRVIHMEIYVASCSVLGSPLSDDFDILV